MPYFTKKGTGKDKGKTCVYKKEDRTKVGCTAGPVEKYLTALRMAESDEFDWTEDFEWTTDMLYSMLDNCNEIRVTNYNLLQNSPYMMRGEPIIYTLTRCKYWWDKFSQIPLDDNGRGPAEWYQNYDEGRIGLLSYYESVHPSIARYKNLKQINFEKDGWTISMYPEETVNSLNGKHSELFILLDDKGKPVYDLIPKKYREMAKTNWEDRFFGNNITESEEFGDFEWAKEIETDLVPGEIYDIKTGNGYYWVPELYVGRDWDDEYQMEFYKFKDVYGGGSGRKSVPYVKELIEKGDIRPYDPNWSIKDELTFSDNIEDALKGNFVIYFKDGVYLDQTLAIQDKLFEMGFSFYAKGIGDYVTNKDSSKPIQFFESFNWDTSNPRYKSMPSYQWDQKKILLNVVKMDDFRWRPKPNPRMDDQELFLTAKQHDAIIINGDRYVTDNITESEEFRWIEELEPEFNATMLRYGQKFKNRWGGIIRTIMFIEQDDYEVSYEKPMTLLTFKIVDDPSGYRPYPKFPKDHQLNSELTMNPIMFDEGIKSGQFTPMFTDEEFKLKESKEDEFSWVKNTGEQLLSDYYIINNESSDVSFTDHREWILLKVVSRKQNGDITYRTVEYNLSPGTNWSPKCSTGNVDYQHLNWLLGLGLSGGRDWRTPYWFPHNGDTSDLPIVPEWYYECPIKVNESFDLGWIDEVPGDFNIGDKFEYLLSTQHRYPYIVEVIGFMPNSVEGGTRGVYVKVIDLGKNVDSHWDLNRRIFIPNKDLEDYLMKPDFMNRLRLKKINESSDLDWIHQQEPEKELKKAKSYVVDVSHLRPAPMRYSHDPSLTRQDILRRFKELGYNTDDIDVDEAKYFYIEPNQGSGWQYNEYGTPIEYDYWIDYNTHYMEDPSYGGKYQVIDVEELMFLLDNNLISESKKPINEVTGISFEARKWAEIIYDEIISNPEEKTRLIIDGYDHPEAFDGFPIDYVVVDFYDRLTGYGQEHSGYDKDGNYVVLLYVQPKLVSGQGGYSLQSALNHEMKHAWEDYNRLSKGLPSIEQTKESQQLYNRDYILMLSDQNVRGPIKEILKYYYYLSNLEKSAYLENVYDQNPAYERVVRDIASKDFESFKDRFDLDVNWHLMNTAYDIPFLKKFKSPREFIDYSAEELRSRALKMIKKMNKMKYIHGKY